MGVSTDGQICFGILFDEGYEFPWDDPDDPEAWIESWWLEVVHGYTPPFRIYNDAGYYIDGVEPSQERKEEYYAHRWAFKKSMPELPVDLVNYCSGDYPMYILALKETVRKAARGYPRDFSPGELKVSKEQVETLYAFCKNHGIEFEGAPKWWLSSYWG